MGKFNVVSDLIGLSNGRMGMIASGYRAKSIVGAGIGGTIGAVSDSDDRRKGFLMGAGIGGGLGAGTRALQGRFGRSTLANARMANVDSRMIKEGIRNWSGFSGGLR